MEAKVDAEQGPVPREDVMPRVAIAPSAISRWRRALDQFADSCDRPDLKDPSRYPCETANEVGDGSLILRIEFDSGDEVSMQIASSEWRWSRSTPVH